MNPRIPFLAAALALLASPVAAQDIVALCIGNDAYVNPDDVLDTPVADATLMKRALEALPGGADVELLTDASRVDIVIALNALKERAKGAKLALVFYSGHGMDGRPQGYQAEDTFLLPVEAEIPSEDHLAASAVGLREVLAALKDCPVTARAVILDCCRTGAPKATGALVAAGTKNFGQLDERVKVALGKAVVPDATLVAFAASPGRKAASFLSDEDKNSPFTRFLAEQLGSGVGNLRDLVEAAAEQTELATEGRQVPYVSYNGATSAIKQIVWRAKAEGIAPVVPGTAAEMEALKAQLVAEKKAREEAERKAATTAAGTGTGPVAGTMARTDPVSAGAFPAGVGMEGTRAGEVREFGGIEMAWCPPGEFLMGSPASEADREDDETQHKVTLTRGFWLARTECTQGQWESVMGGNPSYFKGVDLPVERVSWENVQVWLAKMNERHPLPAGWKWELPTEAQWEYACRAGTETAFAGDLDEMAWYDDNSGSETNPVGTKKANGWGLHDMLGNVLEWCRDWHGSYPNGSATNPTGPTTGSSRVLRGGGWRVRAATCRSTGRGGLPPGFRLRDMGFRPAAVPAGR